MTSKGIVAELQEDCLKPDYPLSALLRKAKVIASKLDVPDFEAWIDQELGGYEGPLKDLPPHRIGVGQPKYFNPHRGWQDFIVGDDSVSEMISTARLPQPVAELHQLLDGSSSHVVLGYPPIIQKFLSEQMPIAMNAGLHLSKSFIHGALDHVRNTALEWTLSLEKEGINGTGLSFSNSEKKAAQNVTNHIYNSNIGVIGSVGGSATISHFTNQDGSFNSAKLSDVANQMIEAMPGLPAPVRAELKKPLEEMQAAAAANDKSKAAKALEAVKAVLIGAGGNLVATGMLGAIGAA